MRETTTPFDITIGIGSDSGIKRKNQPNEDLVGPFANVPFGIEDTAESDNSTQPRCDHFLRHHSSGDRSACELEKNNRRESISPAPTGYLM